MTMGKEKETTSRSEQLKYLRPQKFAVQGGLFPINTSKIFRCETEKEKTKNGMADLNHSFLVLIVSKSRNFEPVLVPFHTAEKKGEKEISKRRIYLI